MGTVERAARVALIVVAGAAVGCSSDSKGDRDGGSSPPTDGGRGKGPGSGGKTTGSGGTTTGSGGTSAGSAGTSAGSGGARSTTDASTPDARVPDASIHPDDSALPEAGHGGLSSDAGPGFDAGPFDDGGPFPLPCPLTKIVTLPIADRVDVVVDRRRCRVYVSTKSGSLKSYDIATGQTREMFALGGSLMGMDLSPSEDVLLVANSSTSGTHSWVHWIDLRRGTAHEIEFPITSLESGTFVPLFISEREFLVDSEFAGSGWVPLRRVDAATGHVQVVTSVDQDTMLTANPDRSIVAMAEANATGGPFDVYLPATGTITSNEVDGGWFLYEIAVNRDGSQLAISTYKGLMMYSRSSTGFVLGTTLGAYASNWPLGAVYAPDSSVLYVSYASYSNAGTVEVIDAKSLSTVQTLDGNPGLSGTGNHALTSGRLRISSDGRVLAATVSGGVRLYPVGK